MPASAVGTNSPAPSSNRPGCNPTCPPSLRRLSPCGPSGQPTPCWIIAVCGPPDSPISRRDRNRRRIEAEGLPWLRRDVQSLLVRWRCGIENRGARPKQPAEYAVSEIPGKQRAWRVFAVLKAVDGEIGGAIAKVALR